MPPLNCHTPRANESQIRKITISLEQIVYKSSIDIEPLSLNIHGVNAHFIHHPSNVKNYSIGHKSETDWPKQKQKIAP